VERDLTPAEAAFVSNARVGHLGTQRMGRWPHVVPVCHVLDLDRIVIAYDRKVETSARTRR
jgi:nitroimidazol reductase NimA-like FMN-containing flavoprotein (pyridoxamine 5'-phosphate oxidase superfamily)